MTSPNGFVVRKTEGEPSPSLFAVPPPCQPHTLAFSSARAKGQRTDFEILAVAGDIQPKNDLERCLAQKSWLARGLLAEW